MLAFFCNMKYALWTAMYWPIRFLV